MKLWPVLIIFICTACSFNYQELPEQTVPQPDMIFTNVTLKRYENALVDLNVYAQELEMYDEEKPVEEEDDGEETESSEEENEENQTD